MYWHCVSSVSGLSFKKQGTGYRKSECSDCPSSALARNINKLNAGKRGFSNVWKTASQDSTKSKQTSVQMQILMNSCVQHEHIRSASFSVKAHFVLSFRC